MLVTEASYHPVCLHSNRFVSLLDVTPSNESKLFVDSSRKGDLLSDTGTGWFHQNNLDCVLNKLVNGCVEELTDLEEVF